MAVILGLGKRLLDAHLQVSMIAIALTVPIARVRCAHCGGSLMWREDDPGEPGVWKCESCSRVAKEVPRPC